MIETFNEDGQMSDKYQVSLTYEKFGKRYGFLWEGYAGDVQESIELAWLACRLEGSVGKVLISVTSTIQLPKTANHS